MSRLPDKRALRGDGAFVFHYLRPHRGPIFWAVLLVVVSVFLHVIPARVLGAFIDTLKGHTATPGSVARIVGLLLAIEAGVAVLLYYQRKIITGSSRDMEYDIRRDAMGYLHAMPASFYMKNPTGDIMSRLTNDLSQVREMIGAGVLQSLRLGVGLLMTVAAMLAVSPRHTLLPLLPVILLPVLSAGLLRKIGENSRIIQEKLSAINTVAQETYAGIGEVRAYGRESWRQRLFEEANAGYFSVNMAQARLTGAIWPLFGFVASLSNVVLLWAGGRAVIRGELSVGQLVTLNVYLFQLVWPLIGMGWMINLFQRGRVSVKRIRDFLSQEREFDANGKTPFKPGDIEFRNLTFSYPQSAAPALRNVSIRIPEGRVTAVVGTVGAGKTTLVSLIPRILQPPRGALFIGNTDLLDFDAADLRRNLGMVPQETLLFSDTIRNNILFGAPVGPAEFEEALRVSQFQKDLSEIHGGADQMLGERGINLSGGQKQRVAIARAVLRRPSLILLDDCLSAVDADTEAEILRQFEAFFRGRTILIVSHRVSVVRNADRIYVMDQGRVAEEGTHAELMGRQGLYVRLYEKQRMEED